jgi:hypothetical protein
MPARILKWQDLLRDAVHNNAIKARDLRKIPHLKTCLYWDQAEFLGRIDYRRVLAVYDGGLVKYDGRLYYINKAQIRALSKWVRWDLEKTLTVIGE